MVNRFLKRDLKNWFLNNIYHLCYHDRAYMEFIIILFYNFVRNLFNFKWQKLDK